MAVDGAQNGTLATTRGSNDGGNFIPRDWNVDVLYSHVSAVEDLHILKPLR
jgi:hypothetical protein